MKDLRLYILMRTDMASMKAGRAAAQASHASNAFIFEHGKNKEVKEWQKQTAQGFGTAIVLSGDDTTISRTMNAISRNNPEVPHGIVTDPDYVIVVSNEIARFMKSSKIHRIDYREDGTTAIHRVEWTCAYIFGDKEFLSDYLKDYPLYS